KHSFKSWLLATRPWSFPASGMPILNALGDVDIFLTYSLLPILGTTYVATGAIDAEALWLALPIGLITVGILHANNARDIEHDRLAGIRTFAMNVGKKASAIIYCAEVILPFVWIAAGIVFGVFPILSLLVLPALKPVLDNVKKVMRFPVEGEKMLWGIDEATAKIQLIFSVLLAVSLFVDKAFV
ncbi:MAG: prenyltransferase, partial [Bacteroidaceae bacterium]|nr:prenyltransferase [Bacteroidaceae bacterium]